MIKFLPTLIEIVLVLFFSQAVTLFAVKVFHINVDLRQRSGLISYLILVAVGAGIWIAGAPLLNVNLDLDAIFGPRSEENATGGGFTFGPGIPDFETTTLQSTRVLYGPGRNFEVAFELSRNEQVFVETLTEGYCLINSAEKMWVLCAHLAPPPGGWETAVVRPSLVADPD